MWVLLKRYIARMRSLVVRFCVFFVTHTYTYHIDDVGVCAAALRVSTFLFIISPSAGVVWCVYVCRAVRVFWGGASGGMTNNTEQLHHIPTKRRHSPLLDGEDIEQHTTARTARPESAADNVVLLCAGRGAAP
jgi:hypothetical protein